MRETSFQPAGYNLTLGQGATNLSQPKRYDALFPELGAVGGSPRLRQLRATTLLRWITVYRWMIGRFPSSIYTFVSLDFPSDGLSNRPRLGVDNIIKILLFFKSACMSTEI